MNLLDLERLERPRVIVQAACQGKPMQFVEEMSRLRLHKKHHTKCMNSVKMKILLSQLHLPQHAQPSLLSEHAVYAQNLEVNIEEVDGALQGDL